MDGEINFKDMHVAYFSMEIGIANNIPTFSGGLGVLAGDTLRSNADLEVPVIGITLIYKKGYFKQRIDEGGNQYEEDKVWNPEDYLTRLDNTVTVQVAGRDIKVGCWLYKLTGATGKVNPIIFLDTDFPENSELDRGITDHLYGGDHCYRLTQEIILGIGGVRMLESIGCNVNKHHMNEGHSALLVLELYNKYKDIQKVRERCVFTTHTPVPAGHDQFEKGLAMSQMGSYVPQEIEEEIFHNYALNMTHIGLRFSEFVNGVAKKHGEVSRSMFPGYHIESITNGVHAAFWAAPPMKEVFDKYVPQWEADPFSLRSILGVPKGRVWEAHQIAKEKLINFVNEKYNAGMNKDIFTIGFARRAATYKRGDILFSDPQRLLSIAEKFDGIQIIYAGKAHPQDSGGKDIIRRIIGKMNEVRHKIKVCYIEDYDIGVGQFLISGVDIWLNTPMRPKEASGTSGMKAALNGVPHFSILDGWWIEGHVENLTGWSIGAHPEDTNENNQGEDVNDLYTKLEYIILPTYYNERDDWTNIMRHCIAINGSFFNTHRMVQQYVLNAYFK